MNVFSVSEFVEFLNVSLVEAVFPEGAVIEGEVAEYRVSQDKWIWFLLKDGSSVVSCFATVWQVRTPLEDGMKIRVTGLPKVHPKSGKFSVNVERVELVGEGALRRAFELLKKKLFEEGLFAPERKRPIPRFPELIGLIASRESAAYGDFMRILGNRWGGSRISLAHVQVQGRDAVGDIVGAFKYFNEHPDEAEVLVLTRGGGSLDDLQAFNSEEVCRAVFGSKIPVIVGVGHERDETLADYAADVRASTPSNAAELIAPDRRDILVTLEGGLRLMDGAMDAAIAEKMRVIDSAAERLEADARRRIESFDHLVKDLARYFSVFTGRVAGLTREVAVAGGRLGSATGAWSGKLAADLAAKERLLHGLDPRTVLRRGYALARSERGIIRDSTLVDIGESITVQLFKGSLTAKVEGKD